MTTASPTRLTPDRILKVGSKVFLYVRSGTGGEVKLACQLLGWQEGRFLLVSLPRQNGKAATLPPDESLVLRYVLNGEVFGLRTRLLRIQFQPTPLAFLAFPDEIENVSLRSEERVNVRLPTVISWLPSKGGPNGVHFGFLRDVTPDGGLMELTLPDAGTPMGRSVHLTFALGIDDEIRVNAKVQNVASKGAVYGLGVVFKWDGPDDRERVRVFCKLH